MSSLLPFPPISVLTIGYRYRFAIKGTHIVPRTYVTSRDPLVAADIQRREERCRRAGGIGTAVVLIQCGAVSQVMPVEVDPPAKISWDERKDWVEVFAHFVDSGRTDFKPISTTTRGLVWLITNNNIVLTTDFAGYTTVDPLPGLIQTLE